MNCVGIGKTTMAHELCSRWAKDGFLAEDFDAVILIPLRSLQQRSLKDMIETQIGEENYQLLEKSVGRRCLIILEGFDELSAEHRQKDPFLLRLIKECNKLEEATIIITSRPHACEGIDAGRKVEVVGFGKDEIKEFVENTFANDIQSSKDFLRQLDEYPQLHSLCYIPLNLVILVDVFNCSEKKLPSTLTELYQVFIVMTMKRQVKKEKKPISSTVAVAAADNVEKMLRGIPKETVGIVLCLCRLAYRSFFDWYCRKEVECGWHKEKGWIKDPKIIFTESDLTQCGIEVTGNFDGFGLLKVTETHQLSTDINTYNFNHLTIQEFLCAVHISLVLSQQEQLCLLEKHFIRYPNVVTFVCGLIGLASREIFWFISSRLRCYVSEVITAMRCINESKQSSTSHQLFSPLKLSISYPLLPYDCLCLSNILSCYPVTELYMWNCSIGNKGAEMFMKHYTNKTTTCQLLEKLNLSHNELTSEGMEHMMNIVKTSKHHY